MADQLEVLSVVKSENYEVTVTLGGTVGAPRNELLSREAQKQAMDVAAPYLNRAGFNKHGNWGYIPDGANKILSDEEMMIPGRVIANSGRYVQEYKIAGSP